MARYAYDTEEEVNNDLHEMFRDYEKAIVEGGEYNLCWKDQREDAIDKMMTALGDEKRLSRTVDFTVQIKKGDWEHYRITQHGADDTGGRVFVLRLVEG